jgi:hypothetical protein
LDWLTDLTDGKGSRGLGNCRPVEQRKAPDMTVTATAPEVGHDDVTFPLLCELEPRLFALLAEARSFQPADEEEATAMFCGYPGYLPGLKRRLSRLVGWHSGRTGLLGSTAAYETVYRALLRAIPAARRSEC